MSTKGQRQRRCLRVSAPLSGQQPVMNLALRDVDAIAAELVTYHTMFHDLFQRRERREWSVFYLRGQLSDLLVSGDTVIEHPGSQIFGKGRHRNEERLSHRYTVYHWGYEWVVVSVLVKLPFATRPWAFPLFVPLVLPTEWEHLHGTRD